MEQAFAELLNRITMFVFEGLLEVNGSLHAASGPSNVRTCCIRNGHTARRGICASHLIMSVILVTQDGKNVCVGLGDDNNNNIYNAWFVSCFYLLLLSICGYRYIYIACH